MPDPKAHELFQAIWRGEADSVRTILKVRPDLVDAWLTGDFLAERVLRRSVGFPADSRLHADWTHWPVRVRWARLIAWTRCSPRVRPSSR